MTTKLELDCPECSWHFDETHYQELTVIDDRILLPARHFALACPKCNKPVKFRLEVTL